MSDLFSHPWWLLSLATIGVIAIVGMGLGLFSNLGEDPTTSEITHLCRVDSLDFLLGVAGSTNAPLREGGSAFLHNNGEEFFPAIFAALGRAEKTINLMVYIWEPGDVSDRLFDVLTERARAGVEVRVMADGLGGRTAPDERIERLEAAGGKWCWFHPPRFGQLTHFHKRNHRRAIIVDGEVGFLGGAAIADKWQGAGQDEDHWRDAMVEVRGPIASNLQPTFVQLWSHVTGELLTGSAFFPPDHYNAASRGDSDTAISRHINLLSSPSTDDYPLRRVFWLSFRCAEQTIHITNPYFVPDKVAREVLKERARAGVDVKVLVPNEHNDVRLVRLASQSYYEELLDSGIRIFEYQPTMIHHKHLVVDGVWSVVGSANLDVRSKELNQESVLGIVDREFAASLDETFQRDLERAVEITADEWRRRPRWRRFPERVCRGFEEQV